MSSKPCGWASAGLVAAALVLAAGPGAARADEVAETDEEAIAEVLAVEGVGTAGVRDGRFFIESADERHRVTLGGRVQPRFEYQRREDQENLTRFRFRRLRIDLRGRAFTEDLTFRIMPELRDDARLDTAYVNYRFNEAAQVRLGQYNVPFAWERDVSSSRQQFTERSTANNEFQWPGGGGKDVGVMVHGEPRDDVRYGVGVFGGEGRNLAGEGTEGVMLAGRATWAALGDYPETEALVEQVEGTNLAFGAGAWYANHNAVHDWFIWDDDAQTAHAGAATVDAHWQRGPMALHASGFFRRVKPREGGFDSFEGLGFNVQGGYLLVPERLFGALRYSQAEPDRDRREGRMREVVGGVQVYHHGHRSKVHFELAWAQRHDGDDRLSDETARMQYQLLF